MFSFLQQYLKPYSIPLLISMYIAGLIGYLTPIATWFTQLTTFNLILSTLIVLLNHKHFSPKLVWYIGFACLYGFFIEVIGVKTGLIFGTYYYETTLGWKLWETPLVMGVNWFMLLYISSSFVAKWENHFLAKAFLATNIMVALDFLIEPVAMKYHFWQWENGIVPLQNYIGWWIGAFLLQIGWHKLQLAENNRTAQMLLLLQYLFFGILNLFFLATHH